MSFINYEFFWLLLLLSPLFIYKNFREFSVVLYGYIFTFIFIVLALTRPVIESKPITSDEILSDVILAVDLSYSMQADDIKPTRLAYAKEQLSTLLKKHPKSRFGIIGFTTNAIVLSPLTEDTALLKHLFNSLDEKLIMTKGSSIMPALKLARKMSNSKFPSVVILSDGADEKSYADEAKFAKDNSLRVNIFMIATQFGATLTLENGELLTDETGDLVVSRKNEKIAQIAEATNGVYTQDLSELLDALESQKNKDYKSKTTIVSNIELFYYFIGLAVVTFLVSVTTLKRYILAFLLLFGVSLDANVLDFLKDENVLFFKEANAYYKEGEYEKALLKYENTKSSDEKFKSLIYYNMGNTLVRLKEFAKAREAYKKSLVLFYSKEASENLYYILDVKEEMQMNTGQQKTDKKSSLAKKEAGKKKKDKKGGSSNMKVSANAGTSDAKNDKESASESMLNLNQAKAKLSSKQYELINKRGVDEKQPY